MSISKAIYARISSTAEGSTALYALIKKRVYPAAVAEVSKMPCVGYSHVSSIPVHAMGSDPDLRCNRMQISIYALAYEDLGPVSHLVMKQLKDYSGEPSTHVNIQRIFCEDDGIDITESDPETQVITYQRAQDYFVWYSTNV